MKKYLFCILAALCLFPSLAYAGSAVGSMGNEIQVGTSTLESPTKFVGTGTIQVNKVGVDTVEIFNTTTATWGSISGNPNDQLDTQMSQGEAEAGTNTASKMPSALRLKQAIGQLPGTTTPQVAEMCLGTTTAGSGVKFAGSRLFSQGGIDANTVLLLHCDNPGTTTFIDSGLTPKAVTANGNARGTSTAAVFGSGSAYLGGAGDSLSLADSADWNYIIADAGGALTVDFRVRFLNTGGVRYFFQHQPDASNFNRFYFQDNILYFEQKYGGGWEINVNFPWTPATGTTYHMALVEDHGTWTCYVDGAVVGTPTYDTAPATRDFSGTFNVGTDLYGNLDEFRVSSGVVRWTAPFTPPQNPYDVYTQHDIINIVDVATDGSSDLCVVIGSNTTTAKKTFEVAAGKTTLADSWDTRCDTKLKDVVSADDTIPDRVYTEAKKVKIKDWTWKGDSHGVNTGPMIDDPYIPESIVWRDESGNPAGFKGTGFMSYLYSLAMGIIRKTEGKDLEHEQELAKIRKEVELLRSLLVPSPRPTPEGK